MIALFVAFTLPAAEIVVILDACESGPGFQDFRYEPDAMCEAGTRMAVIFSAQADQVANFTVDDSMALFTQNLVQALAVTAGRDLVNAVDLARRATHDEARLICAGYGP
jgi:hypothetical protein